MFALTLFTGAPPAYATVIRRVYKGSMRGVLIFTAFLGLIWALVMGSEEIRDMGSDNGQYLCVLTTDDSGVASSTTGGWRGQAKGGGAPSGHPA